MAKLTKADLYSTIDKIREKQSIKLSMYPLNMTSLCKKYNNIKLEFADFTTASLRGMAIHLKDRYGIILNNNLNKYERNFYCAHELIHIIIHPRGIFNCFDNIRKNQDTFLEWQANEGGAELLIPYNLLLPIIKKLLSKCNKMSELTSILSKEFNATENVINLRLVSLKYEIYQYLNGAELNDIKILSKNSQRTLGIDVGDIEKILNLKYEINNLSVENWYKSIDNDFSNWEKS